MNMLATSTPAENNAIHRVKLNEKSWNGELCHDAESGAWERKALWDFPTCFGVELQWCHAKLPRRVRPSERTPRDEHALAQGSDLVAGGVGREPTAGLRQGWIRSIREMCVCSVLKEQCLRRMASRNRSAEPFGILRACSGRSPPQKLLGTLLHFYASWMPRENVVERSVKTLGGP